MRDLKCSSRYLMKFNVHSPCPSTCGIVLHAEADFHLCLKFVAGFELWPAQAKPLGNGLGGMC